LAAARKAAPAEAKCPIIGTEVVTFSKLSEAGGFVTGQGIEVKLAGVLAAGAGGETVRQDQLAAARKALDDAMHGGSITLTRSEAQDRYGRTVAQIFAGDVWIQGALLRQGLARAAPDGTSAVCATALLAAENEAREKRLGLWADGVFTVRSPTDLKNRIGTFQIVEGRVVTATMIKGRAYSVLWRKRHPRLNERPGGDGRDPTATQQHPRCCSSSGSGTDAPSRNWNQ
jgi:endonuclease YncB( thermonuclease family)